MWGVIILGRLSTLFKNHIQNLQLTFLIGRQVNHLTSHNEPKCKIGNPILQHHRGTLKFSFVYTPATN